MPYKVDVMHFKAGELGTYMRPLSVYLWSRGESEKLHMLWMYLRYCFKRSPETSRDAMVQRLKFLLKQITAVDMDHDGTIFQTRCHATRTWITMAPL